MDTFLRILSLGCFGGFSSFMTYKGSTESDIKWSGHLSILWKRKVKNFIKKDREKALEVFFDNFKQGKDLKQMAYGLIELLPTSLYLILSSFKEFSKEETSIFFELISTPEFLTYISNLDQEKQELILIHIHNNWSSFSNLESVRLILSQLDPNLVELLYDKISKQKTRSDSSQSIEIMKLWGNGILPILLLSYLKTPTEQVKPLFKELAPEQRVQIFQITATLSKAQFQNFLELISPTENEINYLFVSQHFLNKELRNLLIDWLYNQNLSLDLILKVYQQNKTEDAFSFFANYFIVGIKRKIYPAPDVIASILSFEEFSIAHEILIKLNSSKEHEPVEILVSCLNKLQEQVSRYFEFFDRELETYASQSIEFILIAYFESKYESHHQLLLPFLQDTASKNWKMIIKTTVETKDSPPPNLVFDIFTTCSKRIKQNIGKYIIEQSWITQLTFLNSDFDIFKSALISSKKLSITVQALLDPFLRQHVSERFEEIVLLGKKITFPHLAFVSMMDQSHLKILLNTIGSKKELFQYWEEIFLVCSEDALPIVLKDYLIKEQKRKNYLIPLVKKLVNSELPQFWMYYKTVHAQDISRLEPILIHAFEASIPTIGEVLSQLPEDHFTFIIDNVLPQLGSLGPKMLYSLLSLQDTSNIQERLVQRTILEIVRFDPEELLIIVLIRCSKTITNRKISDFILRLIDKIYSLYPVETLTIIDAHKLIPLLPATKSYLSSLSRNEIERILPKLMNNLKSNILNSIIANYLEQQSKKRKEDLSLFDKMLSNFEVGDFSIEGKNILRDYIQSLVGISSSNDLLIFATFEQKPRSQSQLLPIFFTHTSIHTIEKILLDSPIDPLEENILKSIINHFESQPPEMPEEYFFALYEKGRGKEEVQRALLPLLGEYCSWHNLSNLMELQEGEKYQKEYKKALIKFSSRFDIQSPKALQQIWISGLKDVYNRLKEPETLLQSQCPQCGNPILEKQKNCGFCSQRLTCIICRKSVVRLQIEEEIVQCPQCSSFFHRRHLQESVKIKQRCPVCNVTLQEVKVDSLPVFTFFFK